LIKNSQEYIQYNTLKNLCQTKDLHTTASARTESYNCIS